MTPARRFLFRAFVGIVSFAAFTALLVWVVLRASLPRLDGGETVAGLGADVRIERDAQGVPTVYATDRRDLFFAQGFLHAQERFFQMDLSRRVAKGALAELFGPRALDADRRVRVHGLAAVAEEVAARLEPRRRAQLEAYAAGVNAGLAALGARPFEYLMLQAAPESWSVADTVLVSLAMFLDLTDENAEMDRHRGVLYDTVPPDVYAWLAASGTGLDAPLQGPAVPPPALPDTRWYEAAPPVTVPPEPADAVGSNSFAVAGALTAHGVATLANDMHLGLRVPNIWYRVQLVEGPAEAPGMQAVGVSLPGVPGVIVGSNTHIAWGFTNSYGDWSDRVVLRVDPDTPGRYRVPRGGDTLRVRVERIAVKGAQAASLQVPMTRFGPIVAQDRRGRPVAVRWLAHYPDAVNFELLDLLDVGDVDSALALANRAGMPPQNILVAGADGRIGWTIAGRIPRRIGYDPALPVLSDADGGWVGWLSPADYPRLIDPEAGRLWTANARVASLAEAPAIGMGNYPLGARAGQIRDLLFARDRFDEAGLLAVATDQEGRFLERWRALLRSVLTPEAVRGEPARAELLRILSQGRLAADVDSAAYRLVREFRARIEHDLMSAYVAPARAAAPDFNYVFLRQREGALWQTVQARPVHLLPDGAPDWPAYLLGVADAVVAPYGGDLAGAVWGARNVSRIAHPLSGALPSWLAGWLDMPRQPLPGDIWMPRVQTPEFGASQRLVVSPGREADGLFHMPGGQSGHPLSPFYAAGHADWAAGKPAPLLPGPTRYTLTLSPDDES